jgi:hypothetical protein
MKLIWGIVFWVALWAIHPGLAIAVFAVLMILK